MEREENRHDFLSLQLLEQATTQRLDWQRLDGRYAAFEAFLADMSTRRRDLAAPDPQAAQRVAALLQNWEARGSERRAQLEQAFRARQTQAEALVRSARATLGRDAYAFEERAFFFSRALHAYEEDAAPHRQLAQEALEALAVERAARLQTLGEQAGDDEEEIAALDALIRAHQALAERQRALWTDMRALPEAQRTRLVALLRVLVARDGTAADLGALRAEIRRLAAEEVVEAPLAPLEVLVPVTPTLRVNMRIAELQRAHVTSEGDERTDLELRMAQLLLYVGK